MSYVSKESIEECGVKVEACINVEGSEVMESKSVSLFQNVVHDYTFSLLKNNSLLYTHVVENNGMGIMECLVSTNVASEACVEVQKFANHVVGDNSMCFIH